MEKKRKSLFAKKPFTRLVAVGQKESGDEIYGEPSKEITAYYSDKLVRRRITQEEFLKELDPLGHLVYNKEYYPDIWRQDEETGRWYIEEVPRYAFAFQRIILTKHLTHLCGNDIVFELADDKDDQHSTEVLNAHKRGWAKKNMEIAWYELAYSVKTTGDGAFVGLLEDGKFQWRTFSFNKGDKLFPHYSRKTGKLELFVRKYQGFDEDGNPVQLADVWDDKYYYNLRQQDDKERKNYKFPETGTVLDGYDTSGWVLDTEYSGKHGFPRVPIEYHREDDGPCWSYSQEAIENYEMAFSRLAQSNHDLGLPIMYVKGEGSEELTSADMSYASKVITLPENGEIGFLNRQNASDSYAAELSMLEDAIYRQSFAVRTPELKSGDTPAAAIKMLYSDAVENAINDAQKFQDAVNGMVEIFQWGYGVETNNRLDFMETDIRWYIEPYVHRNVAAEIADMSSAVQNGYLSKQTASEKNYYSTSQEWSRIQKEIKEKQQQELLLEDQRITIQNEHNIEMQEDLQEIQTDAQIEVAKAQAKIDSNETDTKARKEKRSKGNVATGRGVGRPNLSGKKWDSQRNFEGRNNWDEWNATH